MKNSFNTFSKEVQFMKYRWAGSLFLHLVSFIMVGYFYVHSYDKILVINSSGDVHNGEWVENRMDRKVLDIEVYAHLERYYATMWTLDHNNIKKQTAKGLFLGGKVLADLYKEMSTKGFYNLVRRNGYFMESKLDSVTSMQVQGDKIFVQSFGILKLENDQFREFRRLDFKAELKVVDRVYERNPNGLSIEKLDIVNNETIEEPRG